ncbi:MAG: hypothetical protein NTY02_03655 [Acidobacteria bacterium]|nr:hypothetical protein [Acidobacteriota bacterium]
MTRRANQLTFIGAVVCAFVIVPILGWAQTPVAFGVPTSFKVTVKNCQLSTDGGATWITIWTTGIEMNVASVARGQEVLRFVENLPVPSGTYNALRYTVDKTMKIVGSLAFGGSTYFTSTAPSDPTTGPAVEYTFTHPAGDTTHTHAINITALEGGNAYARVNFNIEQGLALYAVGPGAYKIFPNPVTPTITVTPPAPAR